MPYWVNIIIHVEAEGIDGKNYQAAGSSAEILTWNSKNITSER